MRMCFKWKEIIPVVYNREKRLEHKLVRINIVYFFREYLSLRKLKQYFMPYSHICPECGFHSTNNEEICPSCGARKSLNIDESGASDVLYNDVDSRINFTENPSLYVKIIVSVIILFAGIFFLPDFLRNSETFWVAYTITNVFTVIKAADKYFKKLHGLYFYSLFY